MRWLNPLALLGLLAIVLPVLVHLFSRRQARVLPFPTLQFLSVARLLPTRRTRLSDLPLLIIRSAIVALAALALAQPLFSSNNGAPFTGNELARAIIIQSDPFDASLADSTSTLLLERELAQLEDSSATHLRIPASIPHRALAGAVAWLRTQPGLAEIVIISDFANDALDSTDVATIPADIGVSFRRAPAVARADTFPRARGRVLWLTNAPSATTDAVRRAVQDVAGLDVADVRTIAVQSAYTDTIRALAADSLPTIIVASPDVANSRQWATATQPAPLAPWMGDAVVAITRDSTIASTAATVTAPADSAFAATATVLSRSSTGASLSAATPIRVGDSPPLLLIVSRVPPAHLHSAALLLATTQLVGLSSGARSPDTQTVLGDGQLAAWQRAPSARSNTSELESDADSGLSDGRYVWLAVLVLLVGEWIMRTRAASAAALPTLPT